MFTCAFCKELKKAGIASEIDNSIIICFDCVKEAKEKLDKETDECPSNPA